ncbi:Dual oxidase [Mizuhopecten yessoensis]|uniref:NAD(P)H oxidase (H2O2-forming) n=1 Tax=Mizuhopecten yessoensis TaxID=6573 RepID=A0A210QBF2_MIZYE|nr:Dual oxidase [Mizuhopecten yessoensis]
MNVYHFILFFLLHECHSHFAESSLVQRIDGWYNNFAHINWGGAGEPLIHNITTAYTDFTYKVPSNGLPSARVISNTLFRQNMSLDSGGSFLNRSALFAFFGQLVDFELTDVDDTTCPAELLSIPVPRCDPDYDPQCSGTMSMPYERAAYDKNSGQTPNSPRQQLNAATSYIDAGFVYGTNTVRAAFLREDKTAYLASGDKWRKYPEMNDIGVPYDAYPSVSHKIANPLKLWKLGDKHVHENPAVLSLGVLFYRWHNYLAKKFIHEDQENLSQADLFAKSRKWVIASLQNIIVYEWLPKLMKTKLPPYQGYKSSTEPGITAVFDALALRYIMTLIPAGIHQRRVGSCDHIDSHLGPKALRLCNTYFESQNILLEREDGIEETLLGLANQLSEREDIQIVEDIQSKWFGPLHYSRQDHVAQTIMRGRDYGLPDYNTVRKEIGMRQITEWGEINPALNRTNPEVFESLMKLYGDVNMIDPFVGGMLETTSEGPGELFTAILADQFTRIRAGDRFWFENKDSMLFTTAEIAEIRNITLHDVIVKSTQIAKDDLQEDVFTVNASACPAVYVDVGMMEPCTGHKGYDYFAGSEISFIIIWACFGLIPLICVLSAYIAARCRTWRHNKHVRRQQMNRQATNRDAESRSKELQSFNALEWLGEKVSTRPVVIILKPKCTVELTSNRGTRLRTLGLCHSSDMEIYNSTNKGRTTLMIKVPKEYDMCLQFPSYAQRDLFENALCSLLEKNSRQAIIHEVKLKLIHNNTFTQIKRNAVLEKFFKTVFSEAFQMDYDPDLEDSEGESTQTTAEILEIELSKEEFAHALGIKPKSDFVENMFSLLDSDRNGYISYRNFLTAVVLFSKGSCQDKLQLVFRMFDTDSAGSLDKSGLIKMFNSVLEMANSNLGKEEVISLVESMCSQNGLQEQTSFNFDDFCQILSPQMDKIWNGGLEWRGRKNCYPTPQDRRKSTDTRRKSSIPLDTRRKSSASIDEVLTKTPSSNSLMANIPTELRTRFEATREKYHPLKAKIKNLKHFIENNRQNIFFLVLFYGICWGLFAERFYYYTVEREHSGLRALMSYGISVTRGAAAGMSFTFSLLLLTMCRNMITWLRGTFLNLYVPFDSHVAFHKVVAWTALFFTGLHVLGYSFNFYQLATQPTGHLCIFDSIVLRADSQVGFVFWLFGNMTGFTGVLLVILICIIYVFATQTARQLIFNGFWLTHKLIAVLYILTIIHGASLIVQKPFFYVYFIVPAILFTIDKVVSLSRKKTEITVMNAEKLDSDITYLEFKRPSKFEYKSGQWVKIACLSQGRNEYHPFTLTSAPHEDTLSLHIRALGPWTWNIRQTFDPENLKDGPYPKLYLDGPYGAGQQDWYQYDVSVLVGAGIGVTPYASILKDFVHMAMMKNTYRMKCQKLYFVWVTASQRHFEWLLDIIREVEAFDKKGIVSIDIFITKFFQNFDLRTSMLYICEEHFQKLSGGCSVFTGLKANTHFGRPKLNEMFEAVQKAHPMYTTFCRDPTAKQNYPVCNTSMHFT